MGQLPRVQYRDRELYSIPLGDSGMGYTGVSEALITNLLYATAMARVHYYRVPEALPKRKAMTKWVSPEIREEDYLQELAAYAKKYYNTELGKATEEDYLEAFKRWRDA